MVNIPESDPIDPRIQAAADKLRAAINKFRDTQDPLCKKIDRQEAMDELDRAVTTTMAVEEEQKVKNKPKIYPN